MKVTIALITVQILFAVNYSTNKVVLNSIDPLAWSAIRFSLAGVLMVIVSVVIGPGKVRLSPRFLLIALGLSALGISLGLGLFLLGLSKTTSINASVITALVPLLTLILSIIRGKATISIKRSLGFLVSLTGVVLIIGVSKLSMGVTTLHGDLLILAASCSWALFYSYGKSYFGEFDPNWLTAWMFILSGLTFTPFTISKVMELQVLSLSSNIITCAIFTIIGATVVAYTLNNWALRFAEAERVALFMYLQPIVAIFIGWFFLNEPLHNATIAGSFLTIAGVYLGQRS